jgi:septal ring factor EnvC (AmiA/AmiB activator)
MSQTELPGLAPVRQHREAQAERAWLQARDRLRASEDAVEAARAELDSLRGVHHARREALRREYHGRAMSLRSLNGWSEEEHRLLADLAQREQALQVLDGTRAQQAREMERAEHALRQRRRELEKLKVLTELLIEEASHE